MVKFAMLSHHDQKVPGLNHGHDICCPDKFLQFY